MLGWLVHRKQELSLAAAMGRVFPTVKRGMGFATACRRATIELPGS